MPPYALALVIAAAVIHAGWNYLVKTVDEKQIFTWWTLAVGCFLYVPLIIAGGPVPGGIWPYALASAAAESLYFVTLIRAYEHGDFSLIYPVSRGAAPAMLAVWAMLFLDERPEPWGLAGLAVLIVGLTLVGGAGLFSGRASIRISAGGVLAALVISFWISLYSVIDGAAVRIMAPLSYAGLVLAITAVVLTPVIFSLHGAGAILVELRLHRFRIMSVALMMPLTFILVLEAYKLTKVSYVAATREMSVILAALAGWLAMGEHFGRLRTAGSVLIFLGMVLIAVMG